MSARYRLVPTIEVVGILRDRGFLPVRAEQSRTRVPGKGDFTRHLVRFRHADLFAPVTVGEEVPELVLVNSHDGTSAYRFLAGIFRLVCSKGMVVQSADFGSVSVRHSGGADLRERVLHATYQIMDEAPRTLAKIDAWKQVELSPPQREAFAAAPLELNPTPRSARSSSWPRAGPRTASPTCGRPRQRGAGAPAVRRGPGPFGVGPADDHPAGQVGRGRPAAEPGALDADRTARGGGVLTARAPRPRS
jgi:hypothetical protein